MNTLDTFNQNLDRARNLLSFGMTLADAGAKFIENGMAPEEAYMVLKAAQVMDNGAPIPQANPEDPTPCKCCRGVGFHKMSCSVIK